MNTVPVIDIAPFLDGTGPDAVVAAVRQANETIGFLVISGHGVDPGLIVAVEVAAHDFFALPAGVKARYVPDVPWFFRGYEPVGGSALARTEGNDTPPDLCELFRISRFDEPAEAAASGFEPGLEYFFAPNIWPAEVPALRVALSAYYDALSTLGASMMRIFALALLLPEFWFADTIDRHITNLCLNHYPAQDAPPAPGQLRRGAHTDYGSMTILYQDDAPGGLQVQSLGAWEDVPHIPGTYVVNIGDLMSRWTNDRWVSTRHRVVNPGITGHDRLSIPFFHQPNHDALIECLPSCTDAANPPRYRPVTSGEWVMRQTRRQVGAE